MAKVASGENTVAGCSDPINNAMPDRPSKKADTLPYV